MFLFYLVLYYWWLTRQQHNPSLKTLKNIWIAPSSNSSCCSVKTRTFLLKCEFLQRLLWQVIGTAARLLLVGDHCNDNENYTNALKDAPDWLSKRLGPSFGTWQSHGHIVVWRAAKGACSGTWLLLTGVFWSIVKNFYVGYPKVQSSCLPNWGKGCCELGCTSQSSAVL